VRASPLTLAAGQSEGVLELAFGRRPGPFTAPLVVRASLATGEGPVTAEAKVEVVGD
jgi:hypothetical protein